MDTIDVISLRGASGIGQNVNLIGHRETSLFIGHEFRSVRLVCSLLLDPGHRFESNSRSLGVLECLFAFVVHYNRVRPTIVDCAYNLAVKFVHLLQAGRYQKTANRPPQP